MIWRLPRIGLLIFSRQNRPPLPYVRRKFAQGAPHAMMVTSEDGTLQGILTKAEAHCKAKTNSGIFPDHIRKKIPNSESATCLPILHGSSNLHDNSSLGTTTNCNSKGGRHGWHVVSCDNAISIAYFSRAPSGGRLDRDWRCSIAGERAGSDGGARSDRSAANYGDCTVTVGRHAERTASDQTCGNQIANHRGTKRPC